MTQTPEYRRLVRLAGSMNKKAEMLGVHGRMTADALLMIEYQQPNCYYCGIELVNGTFDHVVPLDRNGPNTYANIVRSCMTCNRNKFTKTPDELVSHRALVVVCQVCGKKFRPRWGEFVAGRALVCSRSCSARKRWHGVSA